MTIPSSGSTGAANRWRSAIGAVINLQRAQNELQPQQNPITVRNEIHGEDVYETSPQVESNKPSLHRTQTLNKFIEIVADALEARELLGDDPEQMVPGVREYLFPPPIKPVKGWHSLQGLVLGKRGLLQGLKEMFVQRQVGRGFAKALASTVFIPFQLVAFVVDTPRYCGEQLVALGKRQIISSIRFEGTKQSLHCMLGGAIQMLGGLMRIALPAGIVALGILSGGLLGAAAACLFEAVYFGEDLSKFGNGEYEEMLIFRALRDIVGGLSIIFGAEFIRRLKNDIINPYLEGSNQTGDSEEYRNSMVSP
ncbi:MAG: hypothetical protein VYA34_07660 [Myxococcota bacterium]|nr:hypothetical protein [Myxococcota bacterium]